MILFENNQINCALDSNKPELNLMALQVQSTQLLKEEMVEIKEEFKEIKEYVIEIANFLELLSQKK